MEKLTVPVLKERLREMGLPVSGRKAELVERILAGGAREESAASAGVVFEKEESGGLVSVRARGGLQLSKEVVIRAPDFYYAAGGEGIQPIADICISGVPGWVTVYAKSGEREEIRCKVYTPRGIQTFLREPFPNNCIEY